MQKLVFLLSCCVFAARALNSRHTFAGDIAKSLSKDYGNTNMVMSPLSVQTIFTVVAYGTQGHALAETNQAMHLDHFVSKLACAEEAKRFLDGLAEANPQSVFMANRIFIAQRFTPKPTFREQILKYFRCDIETVDFGRTGSVIQMINDWVAKETDNNIQNIATPSLLAGRPAIGILLVNALYLKYPWELEFAARDTMDRDFYRTASNKIQVPTMWKNALNVKFCSSEELDATAIKIPFAESDVRFMIILPNQKDGLNTLQSRMTDDKFANLNATCKSAVMEVYLPKFKIDFAICLRSALQRLGVNFGQHDFTDMGLHETNEINDVLHKAAITVNELGVEAGAGTVVPIRVDANRLMERATFRVDHPFIYLIEDYNAVYFVGHVVQPVY